MKKLTIGKALGLFTLLNLVILINIAFFTVDKSDILPVLYILLAVFSIVWGAKVHKNWIDQSKEETIKMNP